MILACQKIEKAFGGKSVLNNVNFLINEGEKAAVIGINGAGKTTIFNLLTGVYKPLIAVFMKRCSMPKKRLSKWKKRFASLKRTSVPYPVKH